MAYSREEFNEIYSWWELRDFCYEYNLSIETDLDCVVDDEWLSESIRQSARDYLWDEISRLVSRLYDSRGDGYYLIDCGEATELTEEDFDTAKQQAYDEFRRLGNRFEDEEEEEETGMYPGSNTASMYGRVLTYHNDEAQEAPDGVEQVTPEEFEMAVCGGG